MQQCNESQSRPGNEFVTNSMSVEVVLNIDDPHLDTLPLTGFSLASSICLLANLRITKDGAGKAIT